MKSGSEWLFLDREATRPMEFGLHLSRKRYRRRNRILCADATVGRTTSLPGLSRGGQHFALDATRRSAQMTRIVVSGVALQHDRCGASQAG